MKLEEKLMNIIEIKIQFIRSNISTRIKYFRDIILNFIDFPEVDIISG
ncbi:hypothetical protein LCGC14_1525860 [marine sediment metagenome]|uniref:Uncharacterized protein n=1 Tax=marine sediment metagenome TaxID=412755 RepID=A0A0F9IX72_9ZZZZ